MSADYYHKICCKNIGAAVEITCHDGTVHRGIIDRVEGGKVFLRPLPEGIGGHCGHGTYFWGFGAGLAIGIPLGFIAGLAFLPFFWW